ncbi:SMP-30/gluconolactonase/LRE family protein [Nocardia sp. NPDC048505]|uniref:SMP-30/gluconolactonase/LRE family protein n=1 Tax=unclassified Nocardia TaxID=2637762 RepID=UPI0033E57C8A
MGASEVLVEGIAFGESPRWHDGRLWFADWAAGQVIRVGEDGGQEVMASVESFPLCFDFQPDGHMLLVDSTHARVLRREPGGELEAHAELSAVAVTPWNDIVVDQHSNAYVNNIGFDFPGGEVAPGLVVRVGAEGEVRRVADDLAFPNGMAISPDGETLVVAESYAEQLTAFTIADDGSLTARRVWAPTPGDHPDGICFDTEGHLWYADVGNRHCVRIAEGGTILSTVTLDRGAFACALSRDPSPRLYVVGQRYGEETNSHSGRVVVFPAPAPGAGWP